MADTTRMWWTDGHGKEVDRKINQVMDIRALKGTPGYALLIMAANTHLSAADIQRYFELEGIGRSRNWVYKRRYLFLPPGTILLNGRQDQDGNGERAIELMHQYPRASLRDLSLMLKQHHIARSREWIRIHRGGQILN